ncbi:hypothetical protein DW069_21100 [Bacteroides thetaiotaomicron]|nr:hypothetical protein DW069_21100 [Bacteroides thetaiotaomicron]
MIFGAIWSCSHYQQSWMCHIFYLQKRILFNKLFVSGFLMQKPLNATITIKLANKIIHPIADNANGAINNFSIHNEKS